MRICFPNNNGQASLFRGEGGNFTTSEKRSDSSSWCALPSFLQHTESLHQDLGGCESLTFSHSDALGPHSSKCFTQHHCHFGPLDQGQCTMQIFQDSASRCDGGWGPVCNVCAVSGSLTEPRHHLYINCLEFLAVLLALGRL